jgi:hypothetical protein
MTKAIVLNFKNILSELKSQNLKLCFLKNRGLFIEDNQGNLYQMEAYRYGSYLDNLIKNGIVVKFYQVENYLSNKIGDWEKEVWDISAVEGFMIRQSIRF